MSPDCKIPPSIRRPPFEEYFRICVLALKWCFDERDSQFIFEVSASHLFKKMKAENVPFHRWYPWIEEQLILINKIKKEQEEQDAINRERTGQEHSDRPSLIRRLSNAIRRLR